MNYRPIKVIRKDIYFRPDSRRVLARFFGLGDERSIKIIRRILSLSSEEVTSNLRHVLRNYTKRHRSITLIFTRNFDRIKHVLTQVPVTEESLSQEQRWLIGSYFTMEYAIESAALFNPSIVEDTDQTNLNYGEKRIVLSFRATGEGHVSSIVFRSGIIDENCNIKLDYIGNLVDKPDQHKNFVYEKTNFIQKLTELNCAPSTVTQTLINKLTDTFTYEELKRNIDEVRKSTEETADTKQFLNQAMWIAKSHYEMTFSLDTSISERVIFPVTDTERRGIEDARFVQFKTDEGENIYYATYTGYDGFGILPKLLITRDFYQYSVMPLHGQIANKGAALFPRKINGKYAMLCRVDGENNYIAYSEDISVWRDDVHRIQEPEYPYEFVQLGNCGSPIETEYGWLMINHAVGPMREYVIGATLLDLAQPDIEIGRLHVPLLTPNEREREGYVPNVVYSCGAMVHNGQLILPYAMSDYESTYAVIDMKELLSELTGRRL
ncbi:glycoside hydrolase family 130 protein [Sphingobacteriaceae bacterium WQ 2009]|uniref:Glycoside hydrolase family 130 protein n=1 Tax=Rhinopithecimicrobium faecis TaxID=2820698 RepID=A0A8T4HFM8_9SPHI|nr:glycoside hydrolase family 130 protein [Sphingobacteriaceae bacterium WQ 2009]